MVHMRYWSLGRVRMRIGMRRHEFQLLRDEIRTFGLKKTVRNKRVSQAYVKQLRASAKFYSQQLPERRKAGNA